MNIMRIVVSILLLVFLSAGVQAQTDTLKLASDIWPPFTNVKGQKSVASDLVNLALRRVGVTAINQAGAFGDVVNEIRAENFDGSSALWKSESREKDMVFSAPYLHNQLILVGRKGAEVSARSFSALKGYKLGVVGTYAYGEELNQIDGLEVVSGSSDQENLERLIKDEVDYILVDALLVEYLLSYQEEEVKSYLAIGKWPLLSKSLHFAIRKNVTNAESIMTRFNKEIIRMMMDGTFNKVLELNYIRADIDGDGKLEMIMSGNKAGSNAPIGGYSVFGPSGTQPKGFGNHSYYIDGKKYDSWDEVPGQYKTPMSTEEASKFKILNFGIKK